MRREKIIICQIGKKVQRDVCRLAESARSNFQCSRERLLVHEQNRTLWQQWTATTANDLLLSNRKGTTKTQRRIWKRLTCKQDGRRKENLLPWSTLKVVGNKIPHKNKEKNGYKDLQLRSSRPRARASARPLALRAATPAPNTHTTLSQRDGNGVRRLGNSKRTWGTRTRKTNGFAELGYVLRTQ